tara:strand:- start:317 stop:544 length:228 start_codon:yes stop_codon:yes gene_type:complete
MEIKQLQKENTKAFKLRVKKLFEDESLDCYELARKLNHLDGLLDTFHKYNLISDSQLSHLDGWFFDIQEANNSQI